MSSWLPRRKTVREVLAREPQQAVDERARRRPAIDVVAEEDDRVVGARRDRGRARPRARRDTRGCRRSRRRSCVTEEAADCALVAQQLERRAVGIDVAAADARQEAARLRAEAARRAATASSPSRTSRNSLLAMVLGGAPPAPRAARCGWCAVIACRSSSTPRSCCASVSSTGTCQAGDGSQLQHRAQLGLHAHGAFAIRLVDDEDVGDLEQAGLHHLHRVARFRHQHDDDRRGELHDVELGLTDADGLDDDRVLAERVEQVRRSAASRGPGRRGGRACSRLRMKTAGSSAWSCMRMRSPSTAPPLNGLDGSTATTPTERSVGAQLADQAVDQRRLAGARRSGDRRWSRRGRAAGRCAP